MVFVFHSPSKLGSFEKTAVEKSLFLTVDILVKLLPTRPQLLSVLSLVFNNTVPFYFGSFLCII